MTAAQERARNAVLTAATEQLRYDEMCERERRRRDALNLPSAQRVRMPSFTEEELDRHQEEADRLRHVEEEREEA